MEITRFQFGRPDTQLALLFAGVLVAGNVQRSHVGAKSVDANVDFFAIAAPSSDHVYGADGEDPKTRVLTWPLSTGFNLGWQATPYQKGTFQYQFRFDGYVKDRTTADDGEVKPDDQPRVNGPARARAAVEQ